MECRKAKKLSAVLARAGGFTSSSYPYGAVLERTQVRELEEKTHADLIRRVQAEGVTLKLIPDSETDQKLAKERGLDAVASHAAKVRINATCRAHGVHISADMNKWAILLPTCNCVPVTY